MRVNLYKSECSLLYTLKFVHSMNNLFRIFNLETFWVAWADDGELRKVYLWTYFFNPSRLRRPVEKFQSDDYWCERFKSKHNNDDLLHFKIKINLIQKQQAQRCLFFIWAVTIALFGCPFIAAPGSSKIFKKLTECVFLLGKSNLAIFFQKKNFKPREKPVIFRVFRWLTMWLTFIFNFVSWKYTFISFQQLCGKISL